MKKTLTLFIAALLAVSTVSAQRYKGDKTSGEYSPTVYLIAAQAVDTVYRQPCGECAAVQASVVSKIATAAAILDYQQTHRFGRHQVEKPQLIFATRNNKFSFALGGFVNLRASYSFDGITQNTDFVPYNIPIPGDYATRQALNLDASTTRVYLKAIANTRALGRVVIFIDGDFRGGAPNSYTPRVRSAYVSFKGLTFGRDVSTFCDLQAAPTTIDFQGPNAYNFNFATMIRYELSFAKRHMTLGVAAELPVVSGTYGTTFEPIPQRVPDFPVYLQYAWGKQRQSHIRASAVFRNMYMHDLTTGENTSLFGWGVQFSGRIVVAKPLSLFFNGIYGEGITPYIQDLTGGGLDFTPNPNDPATIQTTPMYGWQAAAQINIIPNKLFISGGYSAVTVRDNKGVYSVGEYKQGQYVFGNIFYNITPRFQMAAEYLYGTRKNMNDMMNHANRVNFSMQYNF